MTTPYHLAPPLDDPLPMSRYRRVVADGTVLGRVFRGAATGRWHAIAHMPDDTVRNATTHPSRTHRGPKYQRLFATAEQAARWVWLQHRPAVYQVRQHRVQSGPLAGAFLGWDALAPNGTPLGMFSPGEESRRLALTVALGHARQAVTA